MRIRKVSGYCVTLSSLENTNILLLSWKSVESIEYVNKELFCSGSSLATSGSTIIGENTGVFVGGLPQGYTIVRKDEGKCDK